MLMFSLLHSYNPSPVLATVGPFTIYWYGLFYTISIILGYWIIRQSLLERAKSSAHSPPLQSPVSNSIELDTKLLHQLPELAFCLVVIGIIGARIYHVLNELSYYWEHPLQIFAIWNGGLAIHGALLGGVIYLWLFTHYGLRITDSESKNSQFAIRNNSNLKKFLFLADLLSPAVILGQAIGRWGNYFNQELFGYPTTLPWGIPISPANRPPEFAEFTYFHPTFLYESLWDFIGFIVLLVVQKRLIVKNNFGNGIIFSAYLIYVSLGRILVELIRVDRVPSILGQRLPLIITLISIVIGFFAFIFLTQSTNKRYN